MAIYRNSTMGALIKNLRDTYSVSRKIVGDEFFNAMAYHYVKATPSRSRNISDYGGNFHDFISKFPPVRSLPYLADVAILEWAWHQAFWGPEQKTHGLSLLTEVNEAEYPKVVFALPENCSLIASQYPIHLIWQTNQEDYAGDKQVDLGWGGVKLLVWRRDLAVQVDVLMEAEWRLLSGIEAGMTVGKLRWGWGRCFEVIGRGGEEGVGGGDFIRFRVLFLVWL